MTSVQGQCDSSFEGVREVFEESFADGQNLGAAVAIFADGLPVVDLWGGVADRSSGRPWAWDTSCVVFSCTKAVTAASALLLAERGYVTLDAPVAQWWPEFADNGKGDVTVEHLLSHQAGLPAFATPVSVAQAADPVAMADRLAAQTPEWEPGTDHGYHALTFGWLIAELVRRHTGLTVGDFVRKEFGSDLWIGAPPGVIARAARISVPRRGEPKSPLTDVATQTRVDAAYAEPGSLIFRATSNPAASYNDPVLLRGGWPAAGMVTTARALARFYRDLMFGVSLRPDTLREAIRERVRGPDRVLLTDSAYGLGFMRPAQSFELPEAARAAAFGHPGAGGVVGLGDPEHRLALAFVPNLKRDYFAGDRRAYRLIEAAYASIT
ncbi:class A beta-lactamase-related serine hydrolase [Rhodococcus sp. ABRD24]|uniref:serine hydrolase domain-containing protein n=1 Tax=Rhodococcus sp. ABRD24 TaxID=2507582 RepID=UPI0010395831|nr:serine hydrolase domain-containing protein [Rhodococcus sp. ABRD24]QBJ95866.1 class A beta-lactamase-related serine hydrolase [Rhodococcus sp. ABRD24]